MMRKPCAAGMFYPADPTRLRAEVERCLGAFPAPQDRLREPVGLIVPHAGYRYSGPVAGAAYAEAVQLGAPEVVVLLGANHSGLGGTISVAGPGAWEAPLGASPVDEPLAEALCRRLEVERDEVPFIEEHSIEVQLPFVQCMFGDVPILPLLVRPAGVDVLARVGEEIGARVADRGAWLVASSDFTHYEPDDIAREQDRRALGPILNLDLAAFLELAQREALTICGVGAIGALLAAGRALGLLDARLVEYRTSGDAGGHTDQVVGYAGVVFRRVVDFA